MNGNYNMITDHKQDDKYCANGGNSTSNVTKEMGLLPKIWGPHMWESLHAISFAYPISPTKEEKEHYKTFFTTLQYVLPCCFCAESYGKFIKTDGTKLDDNALKNRENLTKWLYNLHLNVNKKLGVEYGMTYKMLEEKYENYRATCNMTKESKSNSYKMGERREAPIVSYEFAKKFSNYAKKIGIIDYDTTLEKVKKIKVGSDEWYEHHRKILKIIKAMKLLGKSGVVLEGDKKGTITKYELNLLKNMCTSLSKNDLEYILKKIT